MNAADLCTRLKQYHKRLNGCTIQHDLSSYQETLAAIHHVHLSVRHMNDYSLNDCSNRLKQRVRNGEHLDNVLPEAFALTFESVRRVLGIQPFDEQLMGGIVLHQAKLAEMQTGEGKTLTAVFPAYLNSLAGTGVHILTFNDYLARRDAEWMKPVYDLLGVRSAAIQQHQSITERQNAYRADITYVTAKECGFDFLRDSVSLSSDTVVHRPFAYAIIDEADSILIDEARVPLVIAGACDEVISGTKMMAELVRELKPGKDFAFDEYGRNIFLTDTGIHQAESRLECANLYDEANGELLTRLQYALHAEYLLSADKDYVVRNDTIEIVDEFTGRVAEKRRWPDGLQAAVEAKENCSIRSSGRILNSISLQHFVHHYPKLCGMTATAQPAEEEFRELYNLHIVVIPPHKPCIRNDYHDLLFVTRKEKYAALVQEIKTVHATHRPILVGTQSVAESAFLAQTLREAGISCNVLNAKHDESEAAIIAKAGLPGAVTISTNMAGRGTDIRLGNINEPSEKPVAQLGGLYVIGTNRYESRRIDNQLRGRAGRQGDPGASRFFISLEDDLFVKYRLLELLPVCNLVGHKKEVSDTVLVTKEIDRVQRIIEGQHLEMKVTLFKYSFLIEQQRQILYQRRNEILHTGTIDLLCRERAPQQYAQLTAAIGDKRTLDICRRIALIQLDSAWSRYLAEISELRDGIHLRRFAGQNPLFEFRKLVVSMFEAVLATLDDTIVHSLHGIVVRDGTVDMNATGCLAPSATWTYLVNDDPFAHNFNLQLAGDIGLSAWAALLWPLTAVYFVMNRIRNKKRQAKIPDTQEISNRLQE